VARSVGFGLDLPARALVTINWLIWSFASPSQLILVAAVLAAVFWRRAVGHKLAVMAVGLLLLFGLAPIGNLLLEPLESRFEIPTGLSNVDGIIVLGGWEHIALSDFYSQPQLSDAGDRMTTFLMLAAAHPEARLVHSGTLEVARSLILGAGVAPSRVVLEGRATNTCESAPATRDLVEPRPEQRWLLVTSAAHMPRAVACFRAIDWDVIPYPTDFHTGLTPWSYSLVGNLANLDNAAHEWLGLLYYRVRGYTDEIYPAPGRL
jgi:uncharacterized SAM-binding protein YcdF (DUF218 family)